jgi:hypothetical protein
MSSEDPKTPPEKKAEPLVRDANEDTGLDLFAKPGGNIFGEDSAPSLLLVDAIESDAKSVPSLRETDTPLDADSVALFGK